MRCAAGGHEKPLYGKSAAYRRATLEADAVSMAFRYADIERRPAALKSLRNTADPMADTEEVTVEQNLRRRLRTALPVPQAGAGSYVLDELPRRPSTQKPSLREPIEDELDRKPGKEHTGYTTDHIGAGCSK